MAKSDTSIQYANPIYGEEEIQAVVEALRTTGELQVGPRVREMEERVAAIFDKKHGVMTNSGTSALYLAVELLGEKTPPLPSPFFTGEKPPPSKRGRSWIKHYARILF